MKTRIKTRESRFCSDLVAGRSGFFTEKIIKTKSKSGMCLVNPIICPVISGKIGG